MRQGVEGIQEACARQIETVTAACVFKKENCSRILWEIDPAVEEEHRESFTEGTMTIAEQLLIDAEVMRRQGKTPSEIESYIDYEIRRWNRDEMARVRLEKMMEGITA